MAVLFALSVGLLILFWSALSDRLRVWAVCLYACVWMIVGVHVMQNSLTPQQRQELEQRQQDQKLIEAEIEAYKKAK